MVDWTKKVQTRDGNKARVLATDVQNHMYPIVGVIENSPGMWTPESWTPCGRRFLGQCHGNDVINTPPEKKKLFVNVYPATAHVYQNRASADRGASGQRIQCVEVEYEVPSC